MPECPTCHDTCEVIKRQRVVYRFNGETGAGFEVGDTPDACPTCAAAAEAEWQALTLPPLQRRWAAE